MLWDEEERLPTLALDFDAKNGSGPHSAAADAQAALQLLMDVGLHPFADRSPSGGWHVYAVLPRPQEAAEVLLVASALAQRLPSLDVAPLSNPLHGCLRPPGAAHKTGGFQRLVADPHDVALALTSSPQPNAWDRLRQALTTELQTLSSPDLEFDVPAAAGVKRRALSRHAEELAQSGYHPQRNFPSPSEARFSVICHAVNAGLDLAAIHLALRDRWHWLRDSYGRKHHTALARDFTKAQQQRRRTLLSRHVRTSDTSPQYTQRGRTPADLDVHLALRRFRTLSQEHSRTHHYSPTVRALLRAVLWAGHVQGRVLINTGVRAMAEQAGVHFDTAAEGLHLLANDGLISRVSQGTGPDPDVWRINVGLAVDQPPARGRTHGLQRVFRVLGGHLVADVYEYLSPNEEAEVTTGELATRLGYDRRRVHEALRLLQGWGLATSGRGRWRRGDADPTALSLKLGGEDDWRRQHDLHVNQRRAWRLRLNRPRLVRADPLPGQLRWEAEFALVEPQDEWIEALAGGAPPGSRRSPDSDQPALDLVRTVLGGVVVA